MKWGLRIALILAIWQIGMTVCAGDITGRWLTYDSDSGDRRSIVEITRTNDQIKGHIVELFLNSGEPPEPVCELCSGARRGQRIRGMEILVLKPAANGTGYTGEILDPEEGRSYRCAAVVDAAGKRLSIRGYVGIPLFGRNVIWERVE